MAKAKKTTTSKMTVFPKEKQPFSIPENWFWIDINSINIYSGSSIDPMKKPDTTFELYSVPSSSDDYPEIIIGSEIGSTKQSVIKNDVLLCKINPRINRVWKVSQHTDNELLASSEWIVIRNAVLNPDYLMFCFRTQYFRELMLSNVSGVGGSLMRAQPKFVKNYPIPIAPIAEQQRIVDRIESLFAKLDEAKEKVQAVADSFELRKSAILHKAFTGELTEQWRQAHGVGLDSWQNILLGKCLLPMETRKPTGTYFRYIDIDSINNKHQEVKKPKIIKTAKAPSRASRAVEAGNVLFSMVRPYLKNIALVDETMNDCIASTGFYVCRCKSTILPKFLYELLCSKDALDYLMQFMKGDNSPSIRKDDLLDMKIKLPSIAEQEVLCGFIDEISSKERKAKEASESVINKINTMKKAVLARAFRGELGTNDPTEESAVELLKTVLS